MQYIKLVFINKVTLITSEEGSDSPCTRHCSLETCNCFSSIVFQGLCQDFLFYEEINVFYFRLFHNNDHGIC